MNTTIKSVCVRVCLILACCGSAAGQITTTTTNGHEPTYANDPANVPDALQKVQSGDYGAVHVNMLAHFHATQAVPVLEKQFALRQDQRMKGVIASALVKLHDSDDSYWFYLVNLALPAVVNKAPDYYIYDSQGKATGGPSPEFVAWTNAHHWTKEQAAIAFDEGFDGVLLLAGTGDPRGVPLLRRALLANNKYVQVVAANGLAEAQDTASIPLIITACSKAPHDAASAIAGALIYFNDPKAQATASQYLTAAEIKARNETITAGHKTPYDW